MSARRSGRAKAPVKYTSDSEGSDFGNKKPRKTKATPKKRAKAEVEEDDEPSTAAAAAPSPTKRAKKDADATPAAQDKALKSQRKVAWESYVKAHDVDGALLGEEPAREESITQTDSIKKYGIKKEDLVVLKHFEKKNPNPVFKNTIKLYVKEDVKQLGFRKLGVLDGKEGHEAVKRGGEIWAEEHQNDASTPEKKDKPTKPKTLKQTWTAYIEAHTISTADNLATEPDESINQSDCKAKYSLLPGDLAVLPYFPKPNQKYGNTTKLFSESEVKGLAYRKAAVLGGVEEGDEVVLLEKGRKLLEKE